MKKNSLITVDLDGTTTKFKEYLVTMGREFVGHDVVRTDVLGISMMFDVPKQVEQDFWIKHAKDYYKNAEFKSNASYVINWLISKGHRILFLTHRYPGIYCPVSYEELVYMTNYNLNKNGIYNQDVVYTNENKSIICNKYGSSYHIDDAGSVMLDITGNAKSTKTILIKEDWNRTYMPMCCVSIDNWMQLKLDYDNIA